jgi:hypothetical protein
MLNPALLEMAARDRTAELRRAGTQRSLGARSNHAADTAKPHTTRLSMRHPRTAHPQQAIGWFLVSVGLRLALSRARTSSGR